MSRPKFKAKKSQIGAAYEAAKNGLTDKEIASAIDVPYGTFRKHKEQFIDVLKKGRDEGIPVIVSNLENALLKKACGFEYEEVHERVDSDGNLLEKKTVKKYHSPDSLLLIFALCNLAPAEYRSVNRVNPHRDNQNESTVDKLFDEMASHTPTPYAIPVVDNADPVSDSSIREEERQN